MTTTLSLVAFPANISPNEKRPTCGNTSGACIVPEAQGGNPADASLLSLSIDNNAGSNSTAALANSATHASESTNIGGELMGGGDRG